MHACVLSCTPGCCRRLSQLVLPSEHHGVIVHVKMSHCNQLGECLSTQQRMCWARRARQACSGPDLFLDYYQVPVSAGGADGGWQQAVGKLF